MASVSVVGGCDLDCYLSLGVLLRELYLTGCDPLIKSCMARAVILVELRLVLETLFVAIIVDDQDGRLPRPQSRLGHLRTCTAGYQAKLDL